MERYYFYFNKKRNALFKKDVVVVDGVEGGKFILG